MTLLIYDDDSPSVSIEKLSTDGMDEAKLNSRNVYSMRRGKYQILNIYSIYPKVNLIWFMNILTPIPEDNSQRGLTMALSETLFARPHAFQVKSQAIELDFYRNLHNFKSIIVISSAPGTAGSEIIFVHILHDSAPKRLYGVYLAE